MSENLQDIDDLFRKAADEHEELPSANVWANIDKQLDRKKVVFLSKKYKKLKWAAAALLIFSVGMAMYTLHTRIRNKELVRQNQVEKRKADQFTQPSKHATSTSNPETFAAKDTAVAKLPGLRIPENTEKNRKEGPVSENTSTVSKQIGSEITPALAPPDGSGTGNGKAKAFVTNNAVKTNLTNDNILNLPAINSDSSGNYPGVSAGTKNKSNYVEELTRYREVPKDALFEKMPRQVNVATVSKNETDLSFLPPPNLTILPPLAGFKNDVSQRGIATLKKVTVFKPRFSPKFSVTAFYSHDYVSPNIDNDRRMFREDDRNEIKNKEKVSNTSSKGLLLSYRLGRNWSLQSGLTTSTITTDIQPKTIFARPDHRGEIRFRFNCSAGYSYVSLKTTTTLSPGDSILALSSKNTLQYISVPFVIRYDLVKGRFALQPGVGLAANFLTTGKIETSFAAQSGSNETKSIDHIEGLNSSYVNGTLSLNANYYVVKNIALTFTPVSRFALGAINKDVPVKTYINSFGLAAGLTVGF